MKKVRAVVRLTPGRWSRSFRLTDALSRIPIGLRIVRLDRNPSPATSRFRDRTRLHLHYPQASTSGH
jgi:hypothetical protein